MAVEDTIGSWVPQLFYDVIGRIVPGAIILLSGYVVLVGPASLKYPAFFHPDNVSITVVVLFGLAVSYVTAIICRGFYHAARWSVHSGGDKSSSKVRIRLATHLRGDLLWIRVLILGSQNRLDRVSKDPLFSKMFDFIRLKNPSAGARIAKLHAEQHMIGVLQAGWVLCALVGILLLLCWGDWLRLAASCVLLLFCFGLEAVKLDSLIKTNTAIKNHAELLGFKSESVTASLPGETSIKETPENVE